MKFGYSVFRAAFDAPMMVIAVGCFLALTFQLVGVPSFGTDWVAVGGKIGLAALAFAAGAQFRLSRLATDCPVSFRLCFGGAPLFLVICGLTAFILIPQMSLPTAFLLGGVLMLNGSAFDRRAIMYAPTPALVKAGVRFESAVVLALGLPVVTLLQGNATEAALTNGPLYPLLMASISTFISFAIGGSIGLLAALAGNRFLAGRFHAPSIQRFLAGKHFPVSLAAIGAMIAYILCDFITGNGLIAAAAAGLIWGEQTCVSPVRRLRLRSRVETVVIPLGYFAFGLVLAPRVLGADLLVLTFAIAVVTVMRAAPRLAALQQTGLSKDGQVFLAWFGGTPGAASAMFLLILVDSGTLSHQELLLTVGTVCVMVGVITARLTSQPLSSKYIRGMASAHRRQLFG